MSGELNSTKVLMRVNDGALWHYIAGEINSNSTENFAPIDISSKDLKGVKVFIGEGKRTRDISASLIFNNSLGAAYLRAAYIAKSITQFEIVANGVEDVDVINVMITSWNESSSFGEKLTVETTMQATVVEVMPSVSSVFSVDLWTGDGVSKSIVTGLDTSGRGGLVWTKSTGANNQVNLFFDTNRGATNWLYAGTTGETSEVDTLTAFNNDGFDVGSSDRVNQSGFDYVSWSFIEDSGFFSMVNYTGDGTPGKQVAHGLDSAPGVVFVISRSSTQEAVFQHRSRSPVHWNYLSRSWIEQITGDQMWDSTSPDDTNVVLGNNARVNTLGETYTMYCFAHNPSQFIACDEYLTDGNAEQEIVLGWKPQFVVLWKTRDVSSVVSGGGSIFDTTRGITENGGDELLRIHSTSGQSGVVDSVDLTENGFIVKSEWNNNGTAGDTYIYMAIREE